MTSAKIDSLHDSIQKLQQKMELLDVHKQMTEPRIVSDAGDQTPKKPRGRPRSAPRDASMPRKKRTKKQVKKAGKKK